MSRSDVCCKGSMQDNEKRSTEKISVFFGICYPCYRHEGSLHMRRLFSKACGWTSNIIATTLPLSVSSHTRMMKEMDERADAPGLRSKLLWRQELCRAPWNATRHGTLACETRPAAGKLRIISAKGIAVLSGCRPFLTPTWARCSSRGRGKTRRTGDISLCQAHLDMKGKAYPKCALNVFAEELLGEVRQHTLPPPQVMHGMSQLG
ncbi:hypothetical protein EV126DRAFT_431027 [Verticillium dahliae]|nr:hypothetical protein EV126DRAFT_431027 [Verticillium dahliae]